MFQRTGAAAPILLLSKDYPSDARDLAPALVAVLSVAVALSTAVGTERQLRQKSAGMRTHPLVGLGAALFTIVSRYGRPKKDMWREAHFSDRSRRRIYPILAPETRRNRSTNQYRTSHTYTGWQGLVHTGLPRSVDPVENFTRCQTPEVTSAAPTTQAHQRGTTPPNGSAPLPGRTPGRVRS